MNNARKNPSNKSSSERGNGHALLVISSSPNAWVLDSGDTHHTTSLYRLFSYLETCSRQPIFMGDYSPIDVCGRGRVYLDHGCFQDVLHVPNILVNLLSICQITHSCLGKKMDFTPQSFIIFDLSDGSKIVVGEVNHHFKLYTFSHFTDKYDYVSLLTHDNEDSRL